MTPQAVSNAIDVAVYLLLDDRSIPAHPFGALPNREALARIGCPSTILAKTLETLDLSLSRVHREAHVNNALALVSWTETVAGLLRDQCQILIRTPD